MNTKDLGLQEAKREATIPRIEARLTPEQIKYWHDRICDAMDTSALTAQKLEAVILELWRFAKQKGQWIEDMNGKLDWHPDTEESTLQKITTQRNQLLSALEVLVDHAKEMYPHFESERGQNDIAKAQGAIRLVKQYKRETSNLRT